MELQNSKIFINYIIFKLNKSIKIKIQMLYHVTN